MVTNCFGNRNFMQLMGRLHMHSKCLAFFSFNLGVGGRIFFIFPLFPTCSFQVPNGFPSGSQYVPYVPKFLPLPLAQAKKWWQTVLEIEIACSQWEGSAHTHDGPCFFPFQGGVGWGELFFVFVPCSQCVPNMFSSCSQKVPKFSMCSPRCSQ